MKPKICGVITEGNLSVIKKLKCVDLVEIRIDMIGNKWEKIARKCKAPWIACNRSRKEGGRWQGNEEERKQELFKAIRLGASFVDIELTSNQLEEIVKKIKDRGAKCLISYHNFKTTPSFSKLRRIVKKQINAGADIWKVITTAKKFSNNLTLLQLIHEFKNVPGVSFAMGELGLLSRVLSPLVGGSFTYASLEEGKESAPGQISVKELKKIYQTMGVKDDKC